MVDQLNRKFNMQVDVNRLHSQDLPTLQKEREDLETDIDRLNSLCSRYDTMKYQMESCAHEFE